MASAAILRSAARSLRLRQPLEQPGFLLVRRDVVEDLSPSTRLLSSSVPTEVISPPLLLFPLVSQLVRACMSRWAKWRADPWIPRFGPWGLGLGLGLHGVGRRGQRWLLRLLFYRVCPVFSCDWLQNRDRHCKTLVLFKRRCMQWLRWKNYYKLLMIKMITSGEPGCASASNLSIWNWGTQYAHQNVGIVILWNFDTTPFFHTSSILTQIYSSYLCSVRGAPWNRKVSPTRRQKTFTNEYQQSLIKFQMAWMNNLVCLNKSRFR